MSVPKTVQEKAFAVAAREMRGEVSKGSTRRFIEKANKDMAKAAKAAKSTKVKK